MTTQRQTLAATLAAALLLVGCGTDDDPVATDAAVDADAGDAGADGDADATDDPVDDVGTEEASAGDDEAADDGAEGAADRTGTVSVDRSETHANGVELTIAALRVEQDAIHVDVEAFNAAPFEIFLAAFDQVDLIDDTGRTYNYRPPEDNPGLEIDSGGTLEGTLAFLGRLTDGATSVTVRFNYNGDEELEPSDGEHADMSSAPAFEFSDLPLPGGDA